VALNNNQLFNSQLNDLCTIGGNGSALLYLVWARVDLRLGHSRGMLTHILVGAIG
jgi:hypothetical protein